MNMNERNDRFKAISPARAGVRLASPMTIMVPCLRQCFLWPDALPDANPWSRSYDAQGYGVPILNRGTHRDHSSQQAGTHWD